MLLPSSLLVAALLSFQPQDTGTVWVAELTGSTVSSEVTDLVGVAFKVPNTKQAGFTAEPSIAANSNPAAKAAAIAQAINDDGDNTNGDGNNPQHLVRAVAIGHTVSVVGLNGVECAGLSFYNASRQRGCKVKKLTPSNSGQYRGPANPGALQKEPLASWRFSGSFVGLNSSSEPSRIDFGVIDGLREVSVTLEPVPGDPLQTCAMMEAELQNRGIEAEVFFPEGGGVGVRLLTPHEGIVWGSDDVGSTLRAQLR